MRLTCRRVRGRAAVWSSRRTCTRLDRVRRMGSEGPELRDSQDLKLSIPGTCLPRVSASIPEGSTQPAKTGRGVPLPGVKDPLGAIIQNTAETVPITTHSPCLPSLQSSNSSDTLLKQSPDICLLFLLLLLHKGSQPDTIRPWDSSLSLSTFFLLFTWFVSLLEKTIEV